MMPFILVSAIQIVALAACLAWNPQRSRPGNRRCNSAARAVVLNGQLF